MHVMQHNKRFSKAILIGDLTRKIHKDTLRFEGNKHNFLEELISIVIYQFLNVFYCQIPFFECILMIKFKKWYMIE